MVPIKNESNNRQQSDGYNEIMTLVRQDDICHDPWGTGMAWLFAIADVMWVEYSELMPDYRPAAALSERADLEGWNAEMLIELIDSGTVDEADLTNAYTTLSRYDDWCRRDGKNY